MRFLTFSVLFFSILKVFSSYTKIERVSIDSVKRDIEKRFSEFKKKNPDLTLKSIHEIMSAENPDPALSDMLIASFAPNIYQIARTKEKDGRDKIETITIFNINIRTHIDADYTGYYINLLAYNNKRRVFIKTIPVQKNEEGLFLFPEDYDKFIPNIFDLFFLLESPKEHRRKHSVSSDSSVSIDGSDDKIETFSEAPTGISVLPSVLLAIEKTKKIFIEAEINHLINMLFNLKVSEKKIDNHKKISSLTGAEAISLQREIQKCRFSISEIEEIRTQSILLLTEKKPEELRFNDSTEKIILESRLNDLARKIMTAYQSFQARITALDTLGQDLITKVKQRKLALEDSKRKAAEALENAARKASEAMQRHRIAVAASTHKYQAPVATGRIITNNRYRSVNRALAYFQNTRRSKSLPSRTMMPLEQ